MSSPRPPFEFEVKHIDVISADEKTSTVYCIADIRFTDSFGVFQDFDSIMFREFEGQVNIVGLESFYWSFPKIDPSVAEPQKFFVRFLRALTNQIKEDLGHPYSSTFGSKFAAEGFVTEAYIEKRNIELTMGIGFIDDDGEYKAFSLDPKDRDWEKKTADVQCHKPP